MESPESAFAAAGHGPWSVQQPLMDGCISATTRVMAKDGWSAVLKQRSDAPWGLFAAEAAGLEALRSVPGWHVPEVFGQGRTWLLIEDLGDQVGMDALPFPADDAAWGAFGRALAHCHGRTVSRCGWDTGTFWGMLRFDNRWQEDGAAFYRKTRFRFLLDQPGCRRRLAPGDRRGVERVMDRLHLLAPAEPPCLNHGDLWAGNRLRTRGGVPAVIDPFIHYGWAWCDLHNPLMYGGFPPRFWDAYRECRWLPPRWQEHVEPFFLLHCLGCIAQDIEVGFHGDWLRRLVARYG